MAEKTVVHVGENSPEQVAFKLLELVALVERRSMHGIKQSELDQDWQEANRKWVLDTYNECLDAVKGYRGKPKSWPSEAGQ